jgi:hypothetical protein
MSVIDRVSGSFTKAKSDAAAKWLLKPLGLLLRTGNSAATVDRLFESEHVQDLRLIIAFILISLWTSLLLGFPGSLAYAWAFNNGHWSWKVVFTALRGFVQFYAPAIGIFGAVLAWAYQTGSARLGIVDLFACEIDTLCRVLLVVDSVDRSIDAFHRDLNEVNGAGNSAVRHFTSAENYFPVFENNTRDLQSLEARVVVNITAFYTYMKAFRDSTRTLMDMSASAVPAEPQGSAAAAAFSSSWQEAARNVVYMMFLALESGRNAMTCLVEFEPEQLERVIVILISEVKAYGFLRKQYTDRDDFRHQRLELRKPNYDGLVHDVCGRVHELLLTKPAEWEPAARLLNDLNRSYAAALGDPPKLCRLASIA